MRKTDIVRAIAKETGISQGDVESVINALIDLIKERVEKGEEVHFRGFGKFMAKHRAPKRAMDISRKKPIEIPERFIPYFQPSRLFMKSVAQSKELKKKLKKRKK